MRRVTFTVPRKNRLLATYAVDGTVEWMETLSPGDSKQVRKVAGMLGIEMRDLIAEMLKVGPGPYEMTLPDAASKPKMSLRVRNLMSRDSTDAADFEAALATPGELIEWDDIEQLCCLDIDYHGKTPPAPEWLLATVQRIAPAPWLYWVSKGGGLHLMYQTIEHLTADELAAVAGLSWLHLDRLATIELLKNTRKPPGDVYVGQQTTDMESLRRLFGAAVEESAVAGYLESLGMDMQSSYPHEQCPVRPGSSHATPVFVGESGIVCKKCEAAGVTFGSRKPGFFPYTALCGGGPSDILRRMSFRFCHWDHAAPIIEHRVGLRGEIARLAWKGMLHLAHGDDPRVGRAFTAGNNFIRQRGCWTDRVGELYSKDVAPIVAALPACQDANGAPIPEMVCRFLQPIDLREYGYPVITTIPGTRIYSHHLQLPDDRVAIVTPIDLLKSPEFEGRRPRYDKTMTIEQAWEVLDPVFPGLDHNYLLLLIAAKGISEAQLGMPPNIIVGGVSSSGKSTTVALAAAICGDTHSLISWQKDTQRFMQAYHKAARAGSFVSVDEIMKDADKAGATVTQAMDVFLSLTPSSLSHEMYVGPVPLGRNPVTVVTDIDIPPQIRDDLQISRRFIYLRLGGRVEWQPTVLSTIQKIERLRLADDCYMHAANAVLTHVIDTFFSTPSNFIDIAYALGYNTLDKADGPGFEDPVEKLKKFHRTVEMVAESTDRRWVGGWKVIRRSDETELSELWEQLCDGDGPRWGQSRRVAEQDWKLLLGSADPIRCEVRRLNDTVGIRFVREAS